MSKIEIAIDVNGLEGKIVIEILQNRMVNLFQTLRSYSCYHC